MAARFLAQDGVAASMLLGEIARATVVLPEPLPPNAIVMNCDVEVRDNIKKAIKHLRIVLPGEEDRGQHGVSVLTPIGAALVGLSEGASIKWCTPARDRRSYTGAPRAPSSSQNRRTSGPRIRMRE